MGKKIQHIDSDWLKSAAEGDEFSFRKIYDLYSPGIYRTALYYLRISELAEDVVQETFLALWANRHRIDKVSSIESYLFAIARNECFRSLKAKSILISTDEKLLENITDEPTETDNRIPELIKAIDSLPPQQKKIFVMAKLSGMSHEKISSELKLSPSTVNNHITAAVRSIRNSLRQQITEVLMLIGVIFS